MNSQKTAVFDFDGTIVSKDTGFAFYKWLVLQSKLRTGLMLLLSPVIVLLVLAKKTRVWGLSLATIIATFAESRSLTLLQTKFLDFYFNQGGAVVYQAALTRIKNHQARAEKVLILSGCPGWLLEGVVRYLGITDVDVIGSQQRATKLGLIFSQHCFAKNKIEMAKKAGHNVLNWACGYSDSRADLPFLNLCQCAYLINVTDSVKNSFNKKLQVPNRFLDWQ